VKVNYLCAKTNEGRWYLPKLTSKKMVNLTLGWGRRGRGGGIIYHGLKLITLAPL